MKRIVSVVIMVLGLCLACGHGAWCAGENDIFSAATKGDLAKVQQLIAGDNSLLNAVDIDGRTPLLYASSWGWKEIVVWLLDKGARVNLRDKDNRIPLHWAAGMGWKEVAAVLVAHNSDLWVQDKDKRTPHDLATFKGKDDVAVLLQDAEKNHPAANDTPTDAPEQIYPTRINPVDGAEMVLIPAGEFLMGDDRDSAPGNEKPLRKIYLDGYWAYKNDVTVAQYRSYCTASKRRMPPPPPWGWHDDQPIVDVSWDDACGYAIWAGGAVVGMLPTEAQWEKAARGTDGRIYPWGNTWDVTKCNAKEGGLGKTSPVGSYPAGASPYGLLDMAGNVDQWCLDWYDTNYYATGPVRNPSGPKEAPDITKNTIKPSRVRRGGSYATDTKWVYNAHRNGMYHDGTMPKVGFRVMLLPMTGK